MMDERDLKLEVQCEVCHLWGSLNAGEVMEDELVKHARSHLRGETTTMAFIIRVREMPRGRA